MSLTLSLNWNCFLAKIRNRYRLSIFTFEMKNIQLILLNSSLHFYKNLLLFSCLACWILFNFISSILSYMSDIWYYIWYLCLGYFSRRTATDFLKLFSPSFVPAFSEYLMMHTWLSFIFSSYNSWEIHIFSSIPECSQCSTLLNEVHVQYSLMFMISLLHQLQTHNGGIYNRFKFKLVEQFNVCE